MSANQFRARYVNGVLEPIEPLELESGSEVMVSIVPIDSGVGLPGSAFGSWRGLVDAPELKRRLYESRRQSSGRPVPKF